MTGICEINNPTIILSIYERDGTDCESVDFPLKSFNLFWYAQLKCNLRQTWAKTDSSSFADFV